MTIMNRFTVRVWEQDPDCRPGNMRTIGPEQGFRTARAAYRHAQRMLASPLTTTKALYHQDTRKRGWADISDTGRRFDTVSQPVNIVPSCGELGHC